MHKNMFASLHLGIQNSPVSFLMAWTGMVVCGLGTIRIKGTAMTFHKMNDDGFNA